MKEHKTAVLIVGAGSVELMTAVLRAEAGIEAQLIDREQVELELASETRLAHTSVQFTCSR